MENLKLEPDVRSITIIALNFMIDDCKSYIKTYHPLPNSKIYTSLDLAVSAKNILETETRTISLNELKIIYISLLNLKDSTSTPAFIDKSLPSDAERLRSTRKDINKALKTFRTIAGPYSYALEDTLHYS